MCQCYSARKKKRLLARCNYIKKPTGLVAFISKLLAKRSVNFGKYYLMLISKLLAIIPVRTSKYRFKYKCHILHLSAVLKFINI